MGMIIFMLSDCKPNPLTRNLPLRVRFLPLEGTNVCVVCELEEIRLCCHGRTLMYLPNVYLIVCE